MQEPTSSTDAFALSLADVVGAPGQRPILLPHFARPRSGRAALLGELRPLSGGGTAELAPHVSTRGLTRLGRVRRAARHCLKPKVWKAVHSAVLDTPDRSTSSWVAAFARNGRPSKQDGPTTSTLGLNSLSWQGPGSNDCTAGERALNVATSLPFLAVGFCTRRWATRPLLSTPRLCLKAHSARRRAHLCLQRCRQAPARGLMLESVAHCQQAPCPHAQCTYSAHHNDVHPTRVLFVPGAARAARGASLGRG